MAAKDGFHVNEELNGIPSIFTGNLPLINQKVRDKLSEIESQLCGNLIPTNAKNALKKTCKYTRPVRKFNYLTPNQVQQEKIALIT